MTKKLLIDQYDGGWLGEPMPKGVLEEYAPKIGQLILEFSDLEATLDGELVKVICERADTIGYQIIGPLRFRQKRDLFKNLFGLMIECLNDSELTKKFDHICSGLEDAAEFRNDVAHAQWCYLDEEKYVRLKIKSSKSGPEGIYRKIDLETLSKQTNQIVELAESLYDFYSLAMNSGKQI